MNPQSFDLLKAQRWCILSTLVLTASVVWPTATDSTVAKLPLLVLGATLGVGLIIAGALRNGKASISFGLVEILLLAHLLLFLGSAWWTFDAIYTWNALLFGISSLCIFWVAVHAYVTRRDVTRLLQGVNWLTAGLCAIGAAQYFGNDLLPITFFIGPEKRVPSLLGSSVGFGSYLVLVFPLLLAQTFTARGNTRLSLPHLALSAAAIFMLLLTQTRSSIIALTISGLVFTLFTLRWKRRAMVSLIVALALAGAGIMPFTFRQDISTRVSQMFSEGPKSSFARRLYFWQAGRDAFLASPIAGHGTGSFESTVFDFRSPDYWMASSEDIVPHAHNEVVEIGVEYGAVGLLLCLFMVGLVVYRGLRMVRMGKGWEHWMAAGIISAIAGIAIDNLANLTLRQPPIALLVWLLMGLLFSKALSPRMEQSSPVPVPVPAWTAAIPLLVWGFMALFYGKTELKVVESEVYAGRTMLSREQHDGTALIRDYQAAVTANPLNLMTRWRLAQVYLDQLQWVNAVGAAEALQKLSPRYPQTSLIKAFALFHLHRYPEALESIGQELRQRTHPLSYLVQSAIYRALANEDGEREAIVHLLQKDIEAQQLFAYRSCCQRLIQLNKTEAQSREVLLLFNSLEALLPGDHDFFASLLQQQPKTRKPVSGQ